MIRVGRCQYDQKGQRKDPKWEGFEPVVVLMKSHSEWGSLGPYELRNEDSWIFENIWQGSKVYEFVPEVTQRYSRWDSRVIWSHPAEDHYKEGQLLPAYWSWREKLMKNKYAVRYPVGMKHRSKCLFALSEDDFDQKLDYVEARKKIYASEYCRLVRKQPKYSELVQKLTEGKNLLIIEVDGPHQESLPYYQEKYQVPSDFIEDHSMLVTPNNIKIMLNDKLHPFGHGYCLAMALLNLDFLLQE